MTREETRLAAIRNIRIANDQLATKVQNNGRSRWTYEQFRASMMGFAQNLLKAGGAKSAVGQKWLAVAFDAQAWIITNRPRRVIA